MSRIKPYAGTSRQRLTDLINQANQTNREEGVDFRFSLPVQETGPSGQNTSAVLNPVEGTLFKSPVKVFYNRLDLSVLADLPAGEIQPVVISSAPFWMRTHLSQINDALGLSLLPDEIHNDYVSELSSSYTLRINETFSHAWINSYRFAAISENQKPSIEVQSEVAGFSASAVTDELIKIKPVLDGFIAFELEQPSVEVFAEAAGFTAKEKSFTHLRLANALDGFVAFVTEQPSIEVLAEANGFQPKAISVDTITITPVLDGFTAQHQVLSVNSEAPGFDLHQLS